MLRSKKELIERFISKINADTNVYSDWAKFVREQKEIDLEKLIKEENLNEDETRKFLDNSFRDGEVKTTGTDIEKILPPMRRFGGSNRAEKKLTIINKIKKFFEKYFGLNCSNEDVNNNVQYNTPVEENSNLAMVAEQENEYKK